MTTAEALQHVDSLTDEQFMEKALDNLQREFGLYGLARYFSLYRPGAGDYTAERQMGLHDMSMKNFRKSYEEASKSAV